MTKPLLEVKNLCVDYDIRNEHALPWKSPQTLQAVKEVSFTLGAGETLGIVGESGSGKSTLARAIVQLEKATGSILWGGDTELIGLSRQQMLPFRSQIQFVFQDPFASLNPRLTVGQIIEEPLTVHQPQLSRTQRRERVRSMMHRVSLLPNQINRYPHEFSGGQCQRIGIARALIVEPRLLICDEPVSALDVSIQAQIINLLNSLQKEMGLAMLFIAHDLSVVKHISDRVMVMYLGKVMEMADCSVLYKQPSHPYTQALISAVPLPDPQQERSKKRILLLGDMPSPLSPPSGCVFRTRCQYATTECATRTPQLQSTGNSSEHSVSCHFPAVSLS